jgi:hypothetical protein
MGAQRPHFLGASIYLDGDKIEALAVAQPDTTQPKDAAVKQLLDVVVSILAEEYVRTIKQHPDAFSCNGGMT